MAKHFLIRFYSIWPTRVKLCACTIDRERSTHTSEASMGHKRKPGPVLLLILISMLTQPYSVLCVV